jgi:hypothetical protein
MNEEIHRYSDLREEEFEKWFSLHESDKKKQGSLAKMFYAGWDAAILTLCKGACSGNNRGNEEMV